MNPVSPVTINEQTTEVVIAEGQKEYQRMPVVHLNDGQIQLSRWELSDEDLENIKSTRSVWVFQFTFGHAAMPLRLETDHPVLSYPDDTEGWEEVIDG